MRQQLTFRVLGVSLWIQVALLATSPKAEAVKLPNCVAEFVGSTPIVAMFDWRKKLGLRSTGYASLLYNFPSLMRHASFLRTFEKFGKLSRGADREYPYEKSVAWYAETVVGIHDLRVTFYQRRGAERGTAGRIRVEILTGKDSDALKEKARELFEHACGVAGVDFDPETEYDAIKKMFESEGIPLFGELPRTDPEERVVMIRGFETDQELDKYVQAIEWMVADLKLLGLTDLPGEK